MPGNVHDLNRFPWSTMYKKNEHFANKTLSIYVNIVVENIFMEISPKFRSKQQIVIRLAGPSLGVSQDVCQIF